MVDTRLLLHDIVAQLRECADCEAIGTAALRLRLSKSSVEEASAALERISAQEEKSRNFWRKMFQPSKATDYLARLLRAELQTLRAEKKKGGAPSRRKIAMSKGEIASLAVKLLEGSMPPTMLQNNVIKLITELLDVDNSRQVLQDRICEALLQAAIAEEIAREHGKEISLRDLAKHVGVPHNTLADWRKSKHYRFIVGRVREKNRIT
jgi:hypothetical protein